MNCVNNFYTTSWTEHPKIKSPHPPLEAVSQSQAKGERQSGFKALECGSFRLWEIVACIKSNVFIHLARLNPNG
jgi:hypothetical protein